MYEISVLNKAKKFDDPQDPIEAHKLRNTVQKFAHVEQEGYPV